jgi:5'-3' exonuclease
MGIPYYFVSLIRAHKNVVSRVRAKLQPDILAIDFNCLIHNYMDDARPIESVVEALLKLLDETCQPKLLYIAMDGLVPYGKIVQQRYRRFRIPEGTPVFDRNQISPGTPYMKELDQAIRARLPQAIVSSTDLSGEGEHKLFEWIKTLPDSQRKNVIVYGLDADLILLSLSQTTLCPQLWLLRENQSFQSKIEGFSVLSVHSLSALLPIPAEQYVALCVLCFGNDFMPAIGMFSLREGGHERAIECYLQAGSPDILTPAGRQVFMRMAATQEMKFYQEKVRSRDNPAEKAIVSGDAKHFEARYNLHLLDGIGDTQYLVGAFWKTFHWTLHYFCKNECMDWNWVYPYAEAPLISQLIRYEETNAVWKAKAPKFTVTKQLQFILPQESLRRAHKRVMFPDEFYSEQTDTRIPWMRKFQWECEPRISLPSSSTEDLTTVQSYQYSEA